MINDSTMPIGGGLFALGGAVGGYGYYEYRKTKDLVTKAALDMYNLGDSAIRAINTTFENATAQLDESIDVARGQVDGLAEFTKRNKLGFFNAKAYANHLLKQGGNAASAMTQQADTSRVVLHELIDNSRSIGVQTIEIARERVIGTYTAANTRGHRAGYLMAAGAVLATAGLAAAAGGVSELLDGE